MATVKPKPIGRIVAGGMLREGTPIEHYPEFRLWVKREDLACPPPGPPFSKTRGVYSHIAKRPEKVIGVLDTYHSQAGHAVARACQVLGKQCINYYPDFKHEPGPREPQLRAQALGATLVPLKAGRSSILYHTAKRLTEEINPGGYMMPNALKLDESVEETAKEVPQDIGRFDWVIVPASSGTIAAGVLRGIEDNLTAFQSKEPTLILHLGYNRAHGEVRRYLIDKSGVSSAYPIEIIDERYAYKDQARKGETPPWPCNLYYDLKAFRWWYEHCGDYLGEVLFWNIG